MIKNILLFILFVPLCSTFKPNFEHNSIKKIGHLLKQNCVLIDNLLKKKTLKDCTFSEGNSRDFEASNKDKASEDTSLKLQKYKPFYKSIYQLQLATTIRFKSLLIVFIFLRTVYSLYNNINDIIYIINIIDEKDIKDIKKILDLLSFINFINIFNIFTFLELYDITEHIELINKKTLIYKKYLRLYKKDCFMIKYI
jgi:hypothetical protein